MQYQEGTISVTRNSNIVNAVDPDPNDATIGPATKWLTEAHIGDLLVVSGDDAAYTISSVVSNTQLILSTNYSGNTVTPSGTPQVGAAYIIHRDFTSNYGFPLFSKGDRETALLIRIGMMKVDDIMRDMDDRIGSGA